MEQFIVSILIVPFFGLNWIKSSKILELCKNGEINLACVGSVVTMLTRVQIPSLLSTISTHWEKELNVAKGSASNYFWPMQKPTSHTNGNKNIANYIMSLHVPMACKKWLPIWLMGCVHTHWRRLAIEGCDSFSHI
jgi:hypothetical protein